MNWKGSLLVASVLLCYDDVKTVNQFFVHVLALYPGYMQGVWPGDEAMHVCVS